MRESTFDLKLFVAVIALGLISLSTIFANNKSLAANQLVFWIIGFCLMYIITLFEFRALKRNTLLVYLISITALISLLFVGEKVRGSVRWIDLAFFRLQPSEFAKIATIIALATFFTKNSAKSAKNILLSAFITIPVFSLIFIQPDIGSSLAIIAIWLGILFAAGLPKRFLIILIILFTISSALFYEFLTPYQQQRIKTFINPSADPLGSGYNLIQSTISVGSGQLLGRGLGKGSQSQLNFLPEAESDFIFAAIAEQFGFLGASLVIILETGLIWRLLSQANGAIRFGRLITIGVCAQFIYQFTINVGMNMGIVPVTGITLPLVSYGGSSLISSLILIGIIFSIRRSHY